MEGGGHGPAKLISRHFPIAIEKIEERPPSG
jgi:hypothetical protein